MVFGKQNSAETGEKSNTRTSRSLLVIVDDISSNQENSSSTISKLLPMQPDNVPIHLVSRYETSALNQMPGFNRIQTVVRHYLFKHKTFYFDYLNLNREHQL